MTGSVILTNNVNLINADISLAITAHYIDHEWNQREELLDFQNVPFRHTGENLARHLHDVLHEYQIHDKIYCITTDNASNNTRMMQALSKLFEEYDNITWNGM